MINSITAFGATPISHEKVDFKLNEEQMNYILSLEYNSRDFVKDKLKVTKDIFILNNNVMKSVREFLTFKVEEYKKNVLQINNDLKLTSSWIAINKKNSKHHSHTHRNSFLSTVYYINCKSGALDIEIAKSPLEQGYYFEYDIIQNNVFNSRVLTLDVKDQSLVIFPSWLVHGTHVNKDNDDRIILGADFMIEGLFGSREANDLIEIKLKDF